MIKNVWTIARRDFRSSFTSPVAYIVIAAFLGVMGFMFFNLLDYFRMQSLQFQMGGKAPSLADGIIRPLYGNMNVVYLLLLPFITMRVFAEERKLHTLELLMTSPVTLTEIVVGKFLGSFLFLLVTVGLTLIYPVVLYFSGNPDMGTVLSSAMGTLLMSACYLAVGILCSSLTENQIIAGALTFLICLFFWLISWVSTTAGPVWGDFFTYLSLITHYNNFASGTLNSSDVVFYLSFIGIGLFLTHRVLDSYRWR